MFAKICIALVLLCGIADAGHRQRSVTVTKDTGTVVRSYSAKTCTNINCKCKRCRCKNCQCK